jgi:hypothetical protein
MSIEKGNHEHLRLVGQLGLDEIRRGNRFLCRATFLSPAGEYSQYVFIPEPSPDKVPTRKGELLMGLEPILEFPNV